MKFSTHSLLFCTPPPPNVSVVLFINKHIFSPSLDKSTKDPSPPLAVEKLPYVFSFLTVSLWGLYTSKELRKMSPESFSYFEKLFILELITGIRPPPFEGHVYLADCFSSSTLVEETCWKTWRRYLQPFFFQLSSSSLRLVLWGTGGGLAFESCLCVYLRCPLHIGKFVADGPNGF